jgi:hypothetical protein
MPSLNEDNLSHPVCGWKISCLAGRCEVTGESYGEVLQFSIQPFHAPHYAGD